MQLQLHYTNYATPPLQLHYTTTTTTAALHHTTSSSSGWGDRPGDHCNHCSHSKKHSSNHLLVHQWIRSAIRDSQQPISSISPIGFLFLKLPPPPCAALLVCISLIQASCSNLFKYVLKPSDPSECVSLWEAMITCRAQQGSCSFGILLGIAAYKASQECSASDSGRDHRLYSVYISHS